MRFQVTMPSPKKASRQLLKKVGCFLACFAMTVPVLSARDVAADCPPNAPMGCVGFDTAASANNSNPALNTLTWSHSVSSGTSNRILIVQVSIDTDGANPPAQPAPIVASVVYGSQALAILGGAGAGINSTDGQVRVEMWYILSPNTGTNNITVTLTGAARFMCGSVSAANVVQNQNTFTVGGGYTSGTSSPTNALYNCVTGSLAVGCVAIPGTFTTTTLQERSGQVNVYEFQDADATAGVTGGGSTKYPTDTELTDGSLTYGYSFGPNGTLGNWAMACFVLRPTLVTEVGLTSSSATNTPRGTLVQWETGYEVDNLGFNIYRLRDGKSTLVNRELIAGSALSYKYALSAGYSYAIWDHDGISTDNYVIEDVDTHANRRMNSPISAMRGEVDLPTSAKTASLPELNPPQQEFGSPIWLGDDISSTAKGGPKGSGGTGGGTKPPSTSIQTVLAGESCVKLSVREDGWYRVTAGDLTALGVPVSKIDPRTIQLFVDGQEQSISVVGETDGRFDSTDAVEFYASGVDYQSTDSRVYWLTSNHALGKRIRTTTTGDQRAIVRSFPATVELKERLIYFAALSNGDKENFFGRVIASSPVTLNISTPNLSTVDAGTQIQVALQGATDVSHQVSVAVNNVSIGALNFQNKANSVVSFPVPTSVLHEGVNQVTLTPSLASDDISLVDFVRVTYPHKALADNDSLRVSQISLQQALTFGGFTTNQVRVMDISDPANVVELTGPISQDAAGYRITVTPSLSTQNKLLAFTPTQVKRPADISVNHPSTLSAASNVADIVVIGYSSFLPGISSLVALRQSQGYRVAVVDVDDVYDEFGYGYHTPYAIKDFLKTASSTWAVRPRFVLLVGDASYDPRNYFGIGRLDYVPTKSVDMQMGFEAISDSWFVDFNADDAPDLAIGRLPVASLDQAAVVANKIAQFDGSGRANRSALLVADQNDIENFVKMNQNVRALLPSDFQVLQLSKGAIGADATRSQVLTSLNTGVGFVYYSGHGSVRLWRDNVLTSSDAPTLFNSRLSFYLMSNCLNGYFQDPLVEGLGEALLRAPNGGAVAVWASTGTTVPILQDQMTQEFYRQLFAGGVNITVGEAASRAMATAAAAGSRDVVRSWVLLGDPVTRLQ